MGAAGGLLLLFYIFLIILCWVAPAALAIYTCVLIVRTFSKERRATQPVHSLHPLKAELGILVAVIALLIYSVIDLSQWLAHQWRRRF
jgi:NADH:ubiquinone oxidoreductase subunit 5 (subunit L)/multisubunit Na+/H+ antiporter MnhA subunit